MEWNFLFCEKTVCIQRSIVQAGSWQRTKPFELENFNFRMFFIILGYTSLDNYKTSVKMI